MGWPTKHTGPQIDEALEKGRELRVVNNGWIRLNSSTTTPTNLGDLKNPGNYVTSYWTDGPDIGENVVTPANINVVTMNGNTHQFADIAGKKYSRVMLAGESLYNSWTIDQTEGAINPGPEAPTTVVDGKTVWMDTSNAEAPTLKLYINGEWVEVIPEGTMLASIYDPQGKETDIFKYIDDAITSASLGEVGIDFNDHINDATIHVSEAEKAKWESAATINDVNDAANALQTSLETKVEEVVSSDISKVESLTTAATEAQTAVNDHIANTEIHPDVSKQEEWDNKADAEHTHELDGRVTVDVDHIEGEIPTNLLPYDLKERAYIVSSVEEMYAATKNPVHNGDIFCVETTEEDIWYFVIDDSYLGTEEAEKAFKQFSSKVELNWESIEGTPTTLEGYGITDAVSKTEIEEMQTALEEVQTNLPETTDLSNAIHAQTVFNSAVNNLNAMDAVLTGFEEVINSLESITA